MSFYTLAHTMLNRALAKAGLRLIKYPPDPLNCRLRQIERAGVDLLLDVGANEGQYARNMRRAGYRGEILSFEPNPAAFATLDAHCRADPKWTARNCAVGDAPGRLTLNISENSVSSSALPIGEVSLQAAPEARYVDRVEVDVIALAPIIAAYAGRAMMLKIDVQGYEPKVLAGCGEYLGNIAVLEAEMAMAPTYRGQQTFEEVDAWIRDHGFRRVGFDYGFWNRQTGELLELDGIYARANVGG